MGKNLLCKHYINVYYHYFFNFTALFLSQSIIICTIMVAFQLVFSPQVLASFYSNCIPLIPTGSFFKDTSFIVPFHSSEILNASSKPPYHLQDKVKTPLFDNLSTIWMQTIILSLLPLLSKYSTPSQNTCHSIPGLESPLSSYENSTS